MTCKRCGNKLAPNRIRLCKPCGRNQGRETRLPDGGDVYHPASSSAAANIARHINGIRQHFTVPADKSDLHTLSDFTQAIRNHDLTRRQVIDELHAIKEEYEGRFPTQQIEGIRFDPVSFNVRHALQWANSYPKNPQTTGAGVVTDPDGSPDHPEVTEP